MKAPTLFYETNNRAKEYFKIQHELLHSHTRFVEAFGGSSNYSFRQLKEGKNVLINDKNQTIIEMIRLLMSDITFLDIEQRFKEFDSLYDFKSDKDYQDKTKWKEEHLDSFVQLRSTYNQMDDEDTEKAWLLLYIQQYAHSNELRFSNLVHLNSPLGKTGWTPFKQKKTKHLLEFLQHYRSAIQLSSVDYRDIELDDGDFIYLNSPTIFKETKRYKNRLNYEEDNRWTAKDDNLLLFYLDYLNRSHLPFFAWKEHDGGEYMNEWFERVEKRDYHISVLGNQHLEKKKYKYIIHNYESEIKRYVI